MHRSMCAEPHTHNLLTFPLWGVAIIFYNMIQKDISLILMKASFYLCWYCLNIGEDDNEKNLYFQILSSPEGLKGSYCDFLLKNWRQRHYAHHLLCLQDTVNHSGWVSKEWKNWLLLTGHPCFLPPIYTKSQPCLEMGYPPGYYGRPIMWKTTFCKIG